MKSFCEANGHLSKYLAISIEISQSLEAQNLLNSFNILRTDLLATNLWKSRERCSHVQNQSSVFDLYARHSQECWYLWRLMCISNGPEAKKYNEGSSSASQLVTSHFMNLSVNSKFGTLLQLGGLLRMWMNFAIRFASCQMSGYFELLQRGKLDLWSNPARLARVDPWRSSYRQNKDKTKAV